MTKQEFMESLKAELIRNNCFDKDEILKDFEEHFELGNQEGKSEEEVAKLLGNPKEIAIQFKSEQETDIEEPKISNTNNNNKKGNSIVTKFWIVLALIFFNVTFVLGIVVGIFGALLGFIIASIAIALAGIFIVVIGIVGLFIGTAFIVSSISAISGIFAGIGLLCLGTLFAIGTTYLTIYFIRGLIKYIKWNVDIVQGGI